MTKKLKALIVDDEPNAVDFINSVIGEYCPGLEVVGKAHNMTEGIKRIRELKPDLVFLDVEMPNGTGFDLLSHFPDKEFDVIFITAFNHYAIKAIKFSAVDYILKPLNITEFIEAVNKVIQKRSESPVQMNDNFRVLMENLRSPVPSRLAIPTADGMEYLNPREIIRIEADRSYSWFYLTGNRKLLVSKNLKEFQDLLGDRNFFRSHNSHLINLKYVRKFVRKEGGYIEMQDGEQIPVSRNRKDLFIVHMSRFRG
ncbi:MAG TPA: LytTR family DNA-binding domain-containing protein [Bacteroidales bacterium]|nr:LytTR family DNA-binding domain-containing protein [Bacteroidales bacterium]HPJ58501.1 LytTR family DNA-binding domain-containing protein [Bacteroidales bacterium]HPR11676.1 LytTR family DNA-binding domain-containing protein [Bacteroidales bacterium]